MIGLKIVNLKVKVEDQLILNGVDLHILPGEIHAIMGPNATGKSTLAYSVMGHPRYQIEDGNIFFNGEEITDLSPEERSRAGLFLAFQYSVAIPGVTVANFLRTAVNAHRKARDPDYKGISIPEFRKLMMEKMNLLQIEPSMAGRYLNDGFSGGEKKRVEILQMAILEPKIAVLDIWAFC
jgi:Fe-S cluster assembly ATP-binding protein